MQFLLKAGFHHNGKDEGLGVQFLLWAFLAPSDHMKDTAWNDALEAGAPF